MEREERRERERQERRLQRRVEVARIREQNRNIRINFGLDAD